MGLKDFTLPGFKGDPKYTTVYARSKTEMTGGFSGVVKKVSDADMAAAKTSIEGDLKSSLNKDVIAQVPPDYILYNNAIFYSFQTLPQSDISTSTAKINERGTAYGLMLNKKDLQLTILKKASIDSSGSNSSDINITNLDKLVLTLSDNSFLPDKNSLFNFNLKGDLSLVWQTDVQKLKKDLAGKPKDGLNTVLSSYPSIDEARAVVRPIWKTTFPGNPDKINVIIKNKIK
jgi:hypothetical protein